MLTPNATFNFLQWRPLIPKVTLTLHRRLPGQPEQQLMPCPVMVKRTGFLHIAPGRHMPDIHALYSLLFDPHPGRPRGNHIGPRQIESPSRVHNYAHPPRSNYVRAPQRMRSGGRVEGEWRASTMEASNLGRGGGKPSKNDKVRHRSVHAVPRATTW